MENQWNRNQRKRWWLFLKGATAASNIFGTQGLYRCPICFRDFEMRDAISGEWLTLEHVPPLASGGRPYVLTCFQCNNHAGRTVDSQVKRRENLNSFYEVLGGQRFGERVGAVFEVDGVDVNTEIHRDPTTGFHINILADRNSPKKALLLQETMKQRVEKGTFAESEMHIKSQASCNPRLAEISDLRAAYLGPVATFGYSLIVRKSYDQIREQLRDPEIEHIKGWIVKSHELNRNGFMIVEDVPCIIFCYNQISVLLPHFNEEESLYERLIATWTRGQLIELKGGYMNWPKRMRLALDLEIPSRLGA